MAVDYNSVPLGQAGTGEAFVLGQSQAANQLQNTLQYNQQVAQQQQALRQKQAQDLAASWQKNALKVDGGLYWQPEFNKRYQGHLEKGIQLRQMGVDPFNYNANDPVQSKIAEDYLLERQGILADTANRKATEADLKKSFDLIRKDPSKYYASDIAKLNQFVETPYADAMKMPIPSLEQRFNPNTVLAKITPAQIGNEVVVGNKRIKSVKALPEQTRTAIVSAYNNDVNTARWVDELTGGQGFTIPTLEMIPNTKEGVKKQIETEYNGDPNVRTELAAQGILPNTPEFNKYVESETNRLYDAKSKWNNQIQKDLNQVLPKVKEMSSTLPDYGEANQRRADERLRLAREANQRAMEKVEGKEDGDVLFRQQLVDDMLSGVPNSGERVKAIVAGKGYDEDLKIQVIGNKISFAIPPKTTAKAKVDKDGKVIESATVTPGRIVTIDKAEAGSKDKLNEVLNEVTGENIKGSKFATGQASGKIKGNVVSAAPVSKPSTTMVTMILPNGQSGQIPSDKVADFLKKYPKAKKQ